MYPKKSKDLIPRVASELSLPEDLVKDFVKFYWEKVRASLSSLEHVKVHVHNLGDFNIKHWKIDETIASYQKYDEKKENEGKFNKYDNVTTVAKLHHLKEMINEEKQKSDFIKLHKRQNNE